MYISGFGVFLLVVVLCMSEREKVEIGNTIGRLIWFGAILAAIVGVIAGLWLLWMYSPNAFLITLGVGMIPAVFWLDRNDRKEKALKAEATKARDEREAAAALELYNSPAERTRRGMAAVRENQAARFIGPPNRPMSKV